MPVSIRSWFIAAVLIMPGMFARAETGLRYDHYQPYIFRDSLVHGGSCEVCPTMVLLPVGQFLMGSLPGEGHADEAGPEGLPVQVDLSQSLAMSVAEISVEQFQAFINMKNRKSDIHSCSGFVNGEFWNATSTDWIELGFFQTGHHPAVCVSWNLARAYVNWLTELTGYQYRLPSEAEWEYAAKAGSFSRYWWGDSMIAGYSNCLEASCDTQYLTTAPVISLKSNPFGLYHMLGNVWEWVQDCYVADAYLRFYPDYPSSVETGSECKRVIRGGSWNEGDWSLRSSNREGWLPDKPLNDIGFRVIRESTKLAI